MQNIDSVLAHSSFRLDAFPMSGGIGPTRLFEERSLQKARSAGCEIDEENARKSVVSAVRKIRVTMCAHRIVRLEQLPSSRGIAPPIWLEERSLCAAGASKVRR